MSPRCYKNRHLHFFLCIWPLSFIASNHCIIALEWVLKVSFLVHKGYWVILEFKNPPTCVKQCPSLSDQKQFYTSTHAERNMKTMVGENMFRDFFFFFFSLFLLPPHLCGLFSELTFCSTQKEQKDEAKRFCWITIEKSYRGKNSKRII